MKRSICELLLDYYLSESEVEDFYPTNIANCVFNSFLSYSTIMLNIVTIHAIRKTPSLPKTLKILLLSLAVSDVGVGLVNQPFYRSFFLSSGCMKTILVVTHRKLLISSGICFPHLRSSVLWL